MIDATPAIRRGGHSPTVFARAMMPLAPSACSGSSLSHHLRLYVVAATCTRHGYRGKKRFDRARAMGVDGWMDDVPLHAMQDWIFSR